MEQASMKACAITERQASMWSVLSMSKTNCGFFSMFTQNRRGRLCNGDDRAGVSPVQVQGSQAQRTGWLYPSRLAQPTREMGALGNPVRAPTDGVDGRPRWLGEEQDRRLSQELQAWLGGGGLSPASLPAPPHPPQSLQQEPQARSWFSLEAPPPCLAVRGSSLSLARQWEVHH